MASADALNYNSPLLPHEIPLVALRCRVFTAALRCRFNSTAFGDCRNCPLAAVVRRLFVALSVDLLDLFHHPRAAEPVIPLFLDSIIQLYHSCATPGPPDLDVALFHDRYVYPFLPL